MTESLIPHIKINGSLYIMHALSQLFKGPYTDNIVPRTCQIKFTVFSLSF